MAKSAVLVVPAPVKTDLTERDPPADKEAPQASAKFMSGTVPIAVLATMLTTKKTAHCGLLFADKHPRDARRGDSTKILAGRFAIPPFREWFVGSTIRIWLTKLGPAGDACRGGFVSIIRIPSFEHPCRRP